MVQSPLVSMVLTTPLLHTWLWLGRVQVSHRSSIQHSSWSGDRSLTSRNWWYMFSFLFGNMALECWRLNQSFWEQSQLSEIQGFVVIPKVLEKVMMQQSWDPGLQWKSVASTAIAWNLGAEQAVLFLFAMKWFGLVLGKLSIISIPNLMVVIPPAHMLGGKVHWDFQGAEMELCCQRPVLASHLQPWYIYPTGCSCSNSWWWVCPYGSWVYILVSFFLVYRCFHIELDGHPTIVYCLFGDNRDWWGWLHYAGLAMCQNSLAWFQSQAQRAYDVAHSVPRIKFWNLCYYHLLHTTFFGGEYLAHPNFLVTYKCGLNHPT